MQVSRIPANTKVKMAATRWGCLGPGKISYDFFLAIQDNLPAQEHEFIAVASRDENRAKEFADKFKFKRYYSSYDDVANDKDVDIVYIGTLHTTHVELSLKMLKAGKSVVCEKPMAMNLKQAKLVLDTAKTEKRLFMEACWSRFFPAYDLIRSELDKGSLGEVRMVQANFCLQIAHVDRVKKISMGGGGLLDLGIYCIQLACLVFKEMPESITVVGGLMGDVDEGACVILKYRGGAMANLTYHVNSGQGNNSAVILGQKGKIELDDPFHCATRCRTPSGEHEFPLKNNDYNFVNSSGLSYEAAAARDSLLKGEIEHPKYSHADSIMVHSIMDEVRRQLGVKYPDFD
ncbi:trans-1,2-dihydrobenzene-1,2-diol dehydrogenase-like isoform X2 [Mya arenaria]|uniref:trans-1,2-dihydrobenzene-1,2-diol dehydrogenase-like isoform X2 n=1 Tax=Mya arenaria TaxID=6604 RepID=UPI0022E6F134|nr:trans-1,2-dihydrobenzene-1,2-diol dehydrogenase-like isoform X2 [Mya arenaria]